MANVHSTQSLIINYRNLLQELIQQNHEELSRVLLFNVRNLSNAQYECELSYKGNMVNEGIVTTEKSSQKKLAVKMACKNLYTLLMLMIKSGDGDTFNKDTLLQCNVAFISSMDNDSNKLLKLLKYPSEKEKVIIDFDLFRKHCINLLKDLDYMDTTVIIDEERDSEEECKTKFYKSITDSFVTCDTEKIGELYIIQLMNTFSPNVVPVIIIRKTPELPTYVSKLFNNEKIVKIWCRTDLYTIRSSLDIQSFVKMKYTTRKTNNNNNNRNNNDKSWESVPSLVDCCSILSNVISEENLEKIRYIKSQFKAWHQQNIVPNIQYTMYYSILDIILITKCTQQIFNT